MIDNLRVFQYSFQSKILEKKKRESNPFILYRNSIKKKAPKNIKMTELSKIASNSWKKLSKEEKAEWKKPKSGAECKSPYETTNRASLSHQKNQLSCLEYFQTTSANGQDVESTTVDIPNVVSVTSTLYADTHSSGQHHSNNSNPEVYATMDQLSQTYQHNVAVNPLILQNNFAIDVDSTDDILLLYRPK